MAEKVLYCQRCATPHQANYPWIIWSGFRLDSPRCKDKLISSNTDILQRERAGRELNKRIAISFQREPVVQDDDFTKGFNREINRIKYQAKYQAKKKEVEDLNKYIFWKPKKIKTTWLRGYYKKNVNCPSCNETIPKTCRKCSYCLNYTKPINLDYPTKERNQEIASLLDQGIYTLQEVGDKFGFSRERTRQIYLKQTGKKYTLRKQKTDHEFKLKQTAVKEAKMKELKFLCIACAKPVTYGEAKAKHQYCDNCHAIAFDQFRDPRVLITCKACQTDFHPLRNWKSAETKPQFCTMRCYLQSQGKSINIRKLLNERENRQSGFDAFFFRYMQVEKGLRP